MKHNIIAVVPAYNEEKTIGETVVELLKKVDQVIIVDDCSHDSTSEIAKRAGAVVIQSTQNQGYDGALNLGFEKASQQNATIIITFDADLQHDPEDIPKMLAPILNNEADLVVGIRSFKQRIMEHLLAFYTRFKIKIRDPLSGVKAYRAETYQQVGFFDKIQSTGMQLLFEAYHQGFRVTEIPIHFYPRKGHSRFGNRLKGNYKILKSFLNLLGQSYSLKRQS